MISFRAGAQFDKDVAIVLLTEEQVRANAISDLNWPSLEKELKGLYSSKQFIGASGQIFPLSAEQDLVLCVGLGKEDAVSLTALRTAIRKAVLSGFVKNAKTVEIIPLQSRQDDQSVIALIEGVLIGTYAWTKYKPSPKRVRKSFTIAVPAKKIYRDAVEVCAGVNLTRDLVNDNAGVVNAGYIEKIVRDLCRSTSNISLEVLGPKQLKAKGMGLHLAVNQGSQNEPRLIIARYKGSARKKGYDLALVGKGITFDSGGLNLKTSGHIETMKMDMAGTAAVIGTLRNCLAMKPKKNIVFVCGLAENAIGSGSYRPGDVFKGYAGKTVEIGNTDAEGRLVLADALAYITKNYKPSRIIDLATLTGACIVALGYDYTGLLSNDSAFAQEVGDAARQTDDRVWQLPLYEEMKGCMDSDIADLKNISNIRGAGTMTAAYFLQQFVGTTPWVHLDIAGSAYVDKGSRMYFGSGATGAGVRLLTELIRR